MAEVKAKKISLIGQIFGSVWVIAWSAYKFLKCGSENLSIDDIFKSSIGIVVCFSPVYLNLVLDKIKAIKIGGGA